MPRQLWKGAIRFGLVHVPVSLYPAEERQELSFTMLDKRDMAPVGYKRYNKNTGDEVAYEDIVKGYEVEKGQYVTLEKDDFKKANVEATQTVDIVGFVGNHDIPPYFLESPYYLAPDKHGDKGYALLREVLDKQGKWAVATVVIRTRQHIAVVYARDNVLVLNTLRYQNELKPVKGLEVPADLKDAKVSPNEMKMAERPHRRHDDEVESQGIPRQLPRRPPQADRGESRRPHRKMPKSHAPKEADVIDFAKLLERSLSARKRGVAHAANDEHEEQAAPRRPKSAAQRKARAQAAPQDRIPARSSHRRAA
jgi:DNA end-binding protein Ku